MDSIKIGKYISKKRHEMGITQAQLAEKINVTDKAISKWERGLGCPGIDLIIPIAEALDITVLNLLSGEDKAVDELHTDEIILDTTKTYVKHEKRIRRIALIIMTVIVIILMLAVLKEEKDEGDYLSYCLLNDLQYVSIPLEMQTEDGENTFELSINTLVDNSVESSHRILFTEVFNLETGLPLVGNCDIKLFYRSNMGKIEIFINGILYNKDYKPGVVDYEESYNDTGGYITTIKYNGSESTDRMLYKENKTGGYVCYHGWYSLR